MIRKIKDLISIVGMVLIPILIVFAVVMLWGLVTNLNNTKVITVAGVLQGIKQSPKFTATTYFIDVALRGEKKDGYVPVSIPIPVLTWVNKGVVIFNTKIQVCYDLDKIKNEDVSIFKDKITVKMPSPTFCDENPPMDLVTIYSEGNTDQYKEIENYLNGLAKSYALVFAIQRGIFEDAMKYDLPAFENTLSIISGKKVELIVDTKLLDSYKIQKEEELGKKLNEEGSIVVKLITTNDSIKFFDDLKLKFSPKI